MSGEVRVSIPNNAKKTIQNIREIAGNHSDDEIYAMLKECSMDPNETAQRLLLQDTFHEVKRKRDKKKENLNSKESAETRWRPGTQGRGGRGGRGNYAPRYNSYDAGGRTANAGKENVVNKGTERAVTPSSLPASQEVESKATFLVSSCVTSMSNKPVNASSGNTNLGSASEGRGANHSVESSVSDGNKLGAVLPAPSINTESKTTVPQQNIDYLQVDRHVSRDVTNSVLSSSMLENDASDTVNSSIHGNMPGKSQGVENNQLTEISQDSQPSSLPTQGGASIGRPSSNYGNRPQQPIGSQKVGPIKEWKPKPTTSNPALLPGTIGTSEVLTIRDEAGDKSLPTSSASASEGPMSKLQKKLKELSFSDGQHVIIPNHLQVPEAAKSGLSFGSFDTSFLVNTSYAKGTDNDKSPTPLSESSHEIEETAEDPSSSNQNASLDSHEGDYHHLPQSPKNMPENPSSGEAGGSVPEYDQSKPEMPLPPAGPLYSVVHTAPTYSSFGLMPPILGTQFAPFDSSEPQARDVSRLPSFVSANSLVLSTSGPTPLVTQAAGVMQSSIAMTQQPVPVYRQPAGVHISHYPPNYIPYSQFISPFYVPPPTIHHFLSNAAYPQQPPTGNVYPSPAAAAAATGVKYSLPHYKPGTNTGNSSHIGMPTGYGPYSSSPTGYSPNPTTTAGNSTGSEDRAASQYKENNVYITGQQTEGSAVWVPAPSREVSGLQPGSFYNLPPQGQHVTYAATQGGHGAFTGVYHPQTVAAATVHPVLQQSQSMTGSGEIVGPPTGLYQQQAQQRGQINWTSNY